MEWDKIFAFLEALGGHGDDADDITLKMT